MNKKDLQDLDTIAALAGVDVETTYAEFRKKTGKLSREDFLLYLRECRIIDEGAFRVAQGQEGPTKTDAPGAATLLESMRYDLFDVIAEGAMGKIVLAKDRDLRRDVAIKVLKDDLMSSPVMTRFIAEAQVTAQLDHPNIVPIYSLEIDPSGSVSFAMKLIHGTTLKDVLDETRDRYAKGRELEKQHKLPYQLEVFLRICDAMSYAHSKGVIHRDLKPANIMIGEFREVYVMDWGIARLIEGSEVQEIAEVEPTGDGGERFVGKTMCGRVVGTPRYMSPEQAQAKNDELDERSDLYTLGVILFEIATLKPALTGTSLDDILERAAQGKLQTVSHRFPDTKIPEDLKAIIRKATSRNPDDRYASVRELAEDVRHYMRGEETQARPDTTFRRVLRWMVRHRQFTLFVVLTTITFSAMVGSWSLYQQKQALQRTRIRESRLARYQAHVAAQAHYIDSHFLRFQNMVSFLMETGAYLLQHGAVLEVPLHRYLDLKDGMPLLDDVADSPLYGQPVSTKYATYKLAPDSAEEDAMLSLKRLAPTAERLRKTILDSRIEKGPLTAEEERRLLLEVGMPVRWAYIGLANGAYLCFPGSGDYPVDYDPRTRPWYERGAGEEDVSWGDPYLDIDGKDIVLSCVGPMRDDEGKLLGVAAIDLTFNWIIETFLKRAHRPGVVVTCILDDRGRIVVDSEEPGEGDGLSVSDETLELRLFPHKSVVAAVRKKESGLIEVRERQRQRVIAFYRISTLGWYYVEEADLALLLEEHKP